MKIAILTNAYPPDGRGGAERIVWLQAEGLASRGHEVKVWAPVGGGENENDETIQQSNSHPVEVIRFSSAFHRLDEMNAFSRFLFHLHDFFPHRNVAREIAEWKPEVLITHNLTGCGIGTPKAITNPQPPNPKPLFLHILHDVQLTEPSGQIRQSSNPAIKQFLLELWRKAWSLLRRRFLGTPDVLISPSQWLLDWHHGYGFSGKVDVVLPNPVEAGESRDRERHRPATVAFVGRLSEDKGFADVLEMIPKIDVAAIGAFIIVGDGSLREGVSLLNDPRIELRGTVEPNEARAVIAEADILLAPSRILENQPTVILEAMAEGTPVIATDVGGVRELLDGTGASVLPIADDLGDCLAHEAKELLGDAARWKTISSALRARAEQRHGINGYLDGLERMLNQPHSSH